MINFKSMKGAISDAAMTAIAIIGGITIMLVVPLVALTERNIDVAQASLSSTVNEFASKVVTDSEISQSAYDSLAQKAAAIVQVPVDIEIEVQHFDENPGKKTSTVSSDMIGENLTYSTFDVEEVLKTNGRYPLNKNDVVIVKVSAEKKAFLSLNTTKLEARATGMVGSNATN